MKKNVRNRIIVGGIIAILISSLIIGAVVQRNNNTSQLSKEDTIEKQALTETKEFTEDDFPYNIKFKDIAAGDQFSMALDEEGYLWIWGVGHPGKNGNGEIEFRCDADSKSQSDWPLGMTATDPRNRCYPKKVSERKFSKIFAGDYTAFAIDEEGFLYGWGYNNYHQLGFNDNSLWKVNLTPIKSNLYFSEIDTSYWSTAAIDENGDVWVWGTFAEFENYEANSDYKVTYYSEPTNITNSISTKFIDVAVTQYSCAAIDENGSLWTWGFAGPVFRGSNGDSAWDYGLLCTNKLGTTVQNMTKVKDDVVYKKIDGGQTYVIATDENDNIWSWGKGTGTGLGDTNVHSNPTIITSKRKFTYTNINHESNIALDDKGNVWAWGNNGRSQFGEDASSVSAPINIHIGENFKKVAVSNSHSLLLKEDGTLYGCGNSSSLGIGYALGMSDYTR